MNVITLEGANKTLRNFVNIVSGSYPSYTFTFVSAGIVQVKSKSEHIGDVSIFRVYRNSEVIDQIAISTQKIKQVSRRGAVRTKDLKKALMYFTKYVVPKSLREFVEESEQVAKREVDYIRHTQRRRTVDNFEKLITTTNNVQQITQDLAGVFDLSDWCTTTETTKKLEHNGVMVLCRDDKYVYWYKRDKPASPLECTADTLPYNLRASLALLKLVEKSTVILDRGVRLGDNLFFVLEDKDA